ncbi:MAG: hypothetical protein WC761_00080 [Candidatus Paceibacterota bacterium]|jgi:hypothetical protein
MSGRQKLIGKLVVIPRHAYVFSVYPNKNGRLSTYNPDTGHSTASRLTDPMFGMFIGYEILSTYPYGPWWFVLGDKEKLFCVSEGVLTPQFDFKTGIELCPLC